ncbi:MAG: HDOD domain-containing protein [Desulfobacterales bacterium]|nr:HDOD domain-containing protein [Desulfobacterales bacterium]
MEPERRLSILRSHISKMPPLSPTVSKVLALCNKRDASPVELNRVISMDPVLTGNVLRLINSAYYGLSQKVTSVVRAITMLGINTVRNLLLSTAVLGALGNRKNFDSLDSAQFWEHSLAAGVAARLIAVKHRVPLDQVEGYFIAGLLHDVGKIPLNNRFAEEFKTALHLADEKGQALFKAEQEIFGLDHAAIGKLIAEKWGLGEEISDTIAFHHTPADYSGSHKNFVYLVTLADYFVNTLRIGFSGNLHRVEIPPEVLNYLKSNLGLTLQIIETIIKELSQEVEKSRVFLTLTQ